MSPGLGLRVQITQAMSPIIITQLRLQAPYYTIFPILFKPQSLFNGNMLRRLSPILTPHFAKNNCYYSDIWVTHGYLFAPACLSGFLNYF